MKANSIDYRLYLVTDDPSAYRRDFVEMVEAAVMGGVTVVQYRDTESNGRDAFARARRLQDMLKFHGVPLVVNNDVGLALALGAEGIHVGQGDLPVDVVRRLVGAKMEIGLSLTCLDDIDEAELQWVDLVGIGPVWDARKTKSDAAPAMGPKGFAEIASRVDLPNVAIGGINLETAPQVIAAGAQGVAVVSALSRVDDPAAAARAFRASWGVRTIVALGSNLEPRREYLERALAALGALPATRLVRASSVVETAPVDVPAEFSDLKFLNQVAVLETKLDVHEFSRRMHAIEDGLGRVRSVRNGPRTIDLDLIDFGGLRLGESELTLPHPRATQRAFVMEPLAELGIRLK